MKVIIDGKEYECKNATISNDSIEIVLAKDNKKETGYERVNIGMGYYAVSPLGVVDTMPESNHTIDGDYYDNVNYYSSEEVAKNNARADKLMRQLRRFSILNRKNKIDWENKGQDKFAIYFDYEYKKLGINHYRYWRKVNSIYFDSSELAKQAIEEFKDELIWYFTEYKDSL